MNHSLPEYDWPRLLTHQKESGLSLVDYCSVHNISLDSVRLNTPPTRSHFMEAKLVRQAPEPICQASSAPRVITLNTLAGQLTFPETISSDVLVSVIRGLS